MTPATHSPAEKIRALVAEHLDVPLDEVTLDAHFDADLGADSLDAVEIVLKVEDEFRIRIPDDECNSVRELLALVNEQLYEDED